MGHEPIALAAAALFGGVGLLLLSRPGRFASETDPAGTPEARRSSRVAGVVALGAAAGLLVSQSFPGGSVDLPPF